MFNKNKFKDENNETASEKLSRIFNVESGDNDDSDSQNDLNAEKVVIPINSTSDDIADDEKIEGDAKKIYNTKHSSDIEEKIRILRENAMNTFASESDENLKNEEYTENSQQEEAEETQETVKILKDVPFENVNVMQNENSLDDVRNNAKEDTEKENEVIAVSSGTTKSYDMSELVKILKSDDNKHNKSNNKDYYKNDTDNDVSSERYEKISPDDKDLYEGENYHHYEYEYTDKAQNVDFFKSFRNSAIVASICAVVTLIVSALCFWIELGNGIGLPFAKFLTPGGYGQIYGMICLQAVAICIFCNLDGLIRGVKKLSLKNPAPESYAVIMTVVCIIHTVWSAFFNYENKNYQTFCSVSCLMLLFLSLNTFVKAYTRMKSFTFLLSKKPKFVTENCNTLSEESKIFAKYLSESSEVLTVSQTDFVSDFVKQSSLIPKISIGNIYMYVSLIVSMITSVFLSFMPDKEIYDAVTSGVCVLMFALPVNTLIAVSLPYFVTFIRGAKIKSAIIGEGAPDTYMNSDVLSFSDTEVFPPKGTKIVNIKVYNESRIDKIIVDMVKITKKIGGPLSYVFANAVQNEEEITVDDVLVTESTEDGLSLKIGEDDILFGTSSYLKLYDIEAPVNNSDESEVKSLTSILYYVKNGVVCAKLYIRYSLNKKFAPILKDLLSSGICCGVKTCDPALNDELLCGLLETSDAPVHIVRKNAKDNGKIEEKLSSSVVSVSNLHNFLLTFVSLDKLRSKYKTTSVFSLLGGVIGLSASLVLTFVGGASIATSTVLLFQLLWILPHILVSVFGK